MMHVLQTIAAPSLRRPLILFFALGCFTGACSPDGTDEGSCAPSKTTNEVHGSVQVVGGDPGGSCTAGFLTGEVSDASGKANFTVFCTREKPGSTKPTEQALYFSIDDPRTINETSKIGFTEGPTPDNGAVAPTKIVVSIEEAAGEVRPIPQAVSSDFLRKVRFEVTDTLYGDVAVTVTFTSNDFSKPKMYCPG